MAGVAQGNRTRRDPGGRRARFETAAGIGQFAAIQAVAAPFKVELSTIDVHGTDEIEQGVGTFAREASGGLIITAGVAQAFYRKLIITLAARHRLPTVYAFRGRPSELSRSMLK